MRTGRSDPVWVGIRVGPVRIPVGPIRSELESQSVRFDFRSGSFARALSDLRVCERWGEGGGGSRLWYSCRGCDARVWVGGGLGFRV